MKINRDKISEISIFVSLILLALALRLLLFYIPSPDITKFYAVWYEQFIKIGRIDAFKEVFYDLPPAYLYLIDVMSLFMFIPKEQAVKIISVIFDFIAAFAVFKLIGIKYTKGIFRYIAFLIILFTPTLFIESGMWGQSDIIYTSFLLWSLYFICKEKPFYAIFFFSIAFSFKLQAIFFAPVFIILFLRKNFPFYLFFVIPIVYFISVVPAWLAGGPLVKLLSIYFTQLVRDHALSMRAPNIYMFIDGGNNFDTKVLAGLIFTGLMVATYMVLRCQKWVERDTKSVLLDVVILTVFIPFFLPKMHERYFFTGGVLLIILAMYDRKFIGAAILMQASSLLSYIPYFSSWSDDFARIGAVLNCLLLVWLCFLFYENRKIISKTDLTPQLNNPCQN
jgi:Gpi18-like mannosyltransferase